MDHGGILSVCLMWLEHLHHARQDVPLPVSSAVPCGTLRCALDERLPSLLWLGGSGALTPVSASVPQGQRAHSFEDVLQR